MKRFWTRIKLAFKKASAKRLYLAYLEEKDLFGCGDSLAEYIRTLAYLEEKDLFGRGDSLAEYIRTSLEAKRERIDLLIEQCKALEATL